MLVELSSPYPVTLKSTSVIRSFFFFFFEQMFLMEKMVDLSDGKDNLIGGYGFFSTAPKTFSKV